MDTPTAPQPFEVVFATPVQAGAYLAGAGLATGAIVHEIGEAGEVRFSLVTEAGPAGATNGITVPGVTAETVAAEIRAVVAATVP